jgi:pyrroline-5-carboxylate reductase
MKDHTGGSVVRRKVVIFGAGHMGLSINLGLMRKGHKEIQIVDPNEDRRHFLSQQLGINVLPHLSAFTDDMLVVLAMPPQAFAEFAKTASVPRNHAGLVVSVMAGVTLATIAKSLCVRQVVRSIPNTPSEVFQGMTVFCVSPETTTESIEEARKLFEAFGKAVLVSDEAMLNPATALCGGGPAFVAYFADVMQAFATSVGFDPPTAAEISIQILRGTAELMEVTGKPPMQICREVMTPQGTTERGIEHCNKNQMAKIFHTALSKSSERSSELGRLFLG